MDLFHSTTQMLSVGTLLGPLTGESHFIQRERASGYGWVEDLLEDVRPGGLVSRLTAIFACAKAEDCAAYITAQPVPPSSGGGSPHYYRVRASQYTRAPMAFVGYASRFGTRSTVPHDLVFEYWSAGSHDWSYYEYLCKSALVLEEIPQPAVIKIAAAKFSFYGDASRAKTIWPVA